MSREASPGAAADTGRRCWACGAALSLSAMFCHECGRLQPPHGDDGFARLGLPRRFDLDPLAIDRQHAGFRRRLAPERFDGRGAEEQEYAARHREALDEARALLADPWRRAVHLLALSGHSVPAPVTRDLSPEASAARARLAAAAAPEDVEPVIAEADAGIERLFVDLAAAFLDDALDRAGAIAGEIGRLRRLAAEARIRRAELGRGRGGP